jgi:hypothetical protein
MAQQLRIACMVGAFVLVMPLLSSDRFQDSEASHVGAHETDDLKQYLLLLKEEESVLSDSSYQCDPSTTGSTVISGGASR